MPVAQKIKAAGRTLVGVGTRRSTNRHWAKSCHDFRYYESLVEEEGAPEGVTGSDRPEMLPKVLTPQEEADATIVRAITLLAEAKGDPWVNKAPIFNMVKRLDPTFDPKEFKFATFAGMLKSLEGRLILTRKGEFDQQVRVLTPNRGTGLDEPAPAES